MFSHAAFLAAIQLEYLLFKGKGCLLKAAFFLCLKNGMADG